MADERNYWVVCDDDCRFPAYTKEQVDTAIANATGKTAIDANNAYVTKVKESNANNSLTFWAGSESEFNTLSKSAPNQQIRMDSDHKLYIIPGSGSDDKADKVANANEGDIAVLDSTGNIVDSGRALTEMQIAIPVTQSDNGKVMMVVNGEWKANSDAEKLDKNGDEMLGPLVLYDDPLTDKQAATKRYVDDKNIYFVFGDADAVGYGYDISSITRAASWNYLTEDVSIDLSKYRMIVDIAGFGNDGDKNSVVLSLGLRSDAWDPKMQTILIKNDVVSDPPSVESAKFRHYNAIVDFSRSERLALETVTYGNNILRTASLKQSKATNGWNATITNIKVTSVNSNTVVYRGVIKFERIKP